MTVPVGWAAVPFRRAELSVPGGWMIEGPGEDFFCPFKSSGMIFAGHGPQVPKKAGCRLSASYAWITPSGRLPRGIGHRKPTTVINGLPVYRVTGGHGSVVYLVPALGVRVGARGRLARRLLATLNRSPLDVVLAKGPANPVPARWVRREFGGVKFAVPRAWPPHRQKQLSTCGTGIWPGRVLLINAKKPPAVLPCLPPIPLAAADEAEPGLLVLTGKYAAQSAGETYQHCLVRRGTKICLSADTGVPGLVSGVLIFSVSRPHHHARTFFVLGLSGTGRRARTIFDSITVG